MSSNISKGHGEKKSRKQEHAVIALLSEPSISAAAKVAGIGETTLRRWMQDNSFQEAYRGAKRQAVGQAISRIQQSSVKAVETLEGVMDNSKAPAMARVMAAKTVLDTAIKAVELEEIEARLTELERRSE
ncbi:hypothetical protein [Paenibacillus vini]|uniref:Homeodomain phBC6A51-type domain-containing protein n=1 Tax=Paenibacillus vini TaxID=1476024 RepID=A0ABQ4MGX4_9BACL|nr:hypothetical protein [Paenibacillus vini]GIP55207.1 hypothetical protein J42TS3_42420 [Paenibacillus vini]